MKVIWCLESLSKRCIFKIVRLKAWVTGKQGTKSPVPTDDRIIVSSVHMHLTLIFPAMQNRLFLKREAGSLESCL